MIIGVIIAIAMLAWIFYTDYKDAKYEEEVRKALQQIYEERK